MSGKCVMGRGPARFVLVEKLESLSNRGNLCSYGGYSHAIANKVLADLR